MTSNSKEFVDAIIKGNGRIDPEEAPDNPWATKIVQYTNAWGNTAYGIVFEGEDQNKYTKETEYIKNPIKIWERTE